VSRRSTRSHRRSAAVLSVFALASLLASAPAFAADFVLPTWTFGVGPLDVDLQTGESLVFPSPIGGAHDVSELFTQTAYDTCNVTGATLLAPGGTPNFSIPFSTPGTYYYVCSVGGGGHCGAGMKVRVNVTAASVVPTLGPWGVIVLGLLLTGCGAGSLVAYSRRGSRLV